jgi:hypothetical protein
MAIFMTIFLYMALLRLSPKAAIRSAPTSLTKVWGQTRFSFTCRATCRTGRSVLRRANIDRPGRLATSFHKHFDQLICQHNEHADSKRRPTVLESSPRAVGTTSLASGTGGTTYAFFLFTNIGFGRKPGSSRRIFHTFFRVFSVFWKFRHCKPLCFNH